MKHILSLLAFLALAFCGELAYADPSPSLSTTSQVSCSATAGVVVAAQPAQFHVFTIEQGSATVGVYLGGPGVTTFNGFLIPPVQYSSYTVSFSGPVYCVTSSSTATVYIIETVKGG